MPASFLSEVVLRSLFEVVFYGVGYLVGVLVVPLFSLGMYTVEPWDFRARTKTKKRANQLAPRVVSADIAAAVGLATLFAAAVVWYFIWRAAGA